METQQYFCELFNDEKPTSVEYHETITNKAVEYVKDSNRIEMYFSYNYYVNACKIKKRQSIEKQIKKYLTKLFNNQQRMDYYISKELEQVLDKTCYKKIPFDTYRTFLQQNLTKIVSTLLSQKNYDSSVTNDSEEDFKETLLEDIETLAIGFIDNMKDEQEIDEKLVCKWFDENCGDKFTKYLNYSPPYTPNENPNFRYDKFFVDPAQGRVYAKSYLLIPSVKDPKWEDYRDVVFTAEEMAKNLIDACEFVEKCITIGQSGVDCLKKFGELNDGMFRYNHTVFIKCADCHAVECFDYFRSLLTSDECKREEAFFQLCARNGKEGKNYLGNLFYKPATSPSGEKKFDVEPLRKNWGSIYPDDLISTALLSSLDTMVMVTRKVKKEGRDGRSRNDYEEVTKRKLSEGGVMMTRHFSRCHIPCSDSQFLDIVNSNRNGYASTVKKYMTDMHLR